MAGTMLSERYDIAIHPCTTGLALRFRIIVEKVYRVYYLYNPPQFTV